MVSPTRQAIEWERSIADFSASGFVLAREVDRLRDVHELGAHEATVFYCARILEVLAREAIRIAGVEPASTPFPNLVALSDLQLLRGDTLSWAHAIRRLGNATRHILSSIEPHDAELACVLLERVLRWYFCELPVGPRARALTNSGDIRLTVSRPLRDLIEQVDRYATRREWEISRTQLDFITGVPQLAAVLAERILDFGHIERSRLVLDDALAKHPTDLRLRQLRGLLASRAGQLDQALVWLEPLRKTSPDDPETIGILAGVWKRRWLSNPEDTKSADAALRLYRSGWERTRSPYLGINAASLSVRQGQPLAARTVAASVLRTLDDRRASLARFEGTPTFWEEVTRAEALLLSGELAASRRTYDDAFAAYPEQVAGADVANGQLSWLMSCMGIRQTNLATPQARPDAPRFVLAVTGHRRLVCTDDLLNRVREALWTIQGQLTDETVVVIRSGYAEGADQIVTRIAHESIRQIETEIHVPLEIQDYERDFDDLDALEEFRNGISRCTRVVFPTEDHHQRPVAYMSIGRSIVDGAHALLALWDGLPARGIGGTADVVYYARENRVRVVVVDPQSGERQS